MISAECRTSQNRVISILSVSKGSLYYKKQGYPSERKSTKKRDLLQVECIRTLCHERQTYGVPRIRALLSRDHQLLLSYHLVYSIMKESNLLIKRKQGDRSRRTHKGKIEVPEPNRRFCSAITSIKFWNGEKLRFAYILDCCDRSVLAYRFQKHIQAVDIELMVQEALFRRFSSDNGQNVEFLHDNGPEYIEKKLQKQLKKWNVINCNTPTYSPQSNGMSEAFNGTFKRDYVYLSCLDNVDTVKNKFKDWIEDYNGFAPHSALGMKTPDEFFKLKMAA